MQLRALSIGRLVDTWKPQTGVVHSAFDRAVNLLVHGEMWTLLGAQQPDTSFGIRLPASVRPGQLNVRVADRVHVRAGYVGVGRLIVDCRTAARWAPAPWRQPAAGLEARLSAAEKTARPRAWRESAGMAGDVIDALSRSGSPSDAQLSSAVRRIVGRGPGLTPSGDDVLVGILAVLTSGATGPAGVHATDRLVASLAPVLCSTSDVSRHFLDQAARGLPGRALHDLGKALIEGKPDDLLEDALELVLDTGCTSGADACAGLAAACRLCFLTRRAAA